MKSIRCFLVPAECDGLAIGPNAVVIDILRASTTICQALAQGAQAIRPFPEVELAAEFAREHPRRVLTGGERQGEKLPGFDLGNSPLEYTAEKVADRTIAFTTTNGTRAMERCKSAAEVVIGSFCNLTAVAEHLGEADAVDLICAGTNGEMSTEDCAFAGALAEKFLSAGDWEQNEGVATCLQFWNDARDRLPEFLRTGLGGRNLLRLQRDEDIDFAAQLDTIPLVPRLDVATWTIQPAWTAGHPVH